MVHGGLSLTEEVHSKLEATKLHNNIELVESEKFVIWSPPLLSVMQ